MVLFHESSGVDIFCEYDRTELFWRPNPPLSLLNTDTLRVEQQRELEPDAHRCKIIDFLYKESLVTSNAPKYVTFNKL